MKNLAGQWHGEFTGREGGGPALLDLDDCGDHYEGSAYAFEVAEDQPGTVLTLKSDSLSSEQEFQVTSVRALHPTEPRTIDVTQYPDWVFGSDVNIAFKLEHDEALTAAWQFDGEGFYNTGTARLRRSRADTPSKVGAESAVTDWEGFQKYVAATVATNRKFIFRGQSEPWRLRTSFHRTVRKDLLKHWEQDIPQVHLRTIGQTDFQFDLNYSVHSGAFYHLIQHHGYPTPLLDWTYSPYIAAWFAYYNATATERTSDNVRIYMFDAEAWKRDFNQVIYATFCRPHFSIFEPPPLGNERARTQQAVASITNMDDVETYLRYQEAEKEETYLRAVDLPFSEREKALSSLTLMGITPATMFPGPDGICEEMKSRHFGL